MRVLVTGSSGHVGGAIVRTLRDAGVDTVGLSRGRDATAPVDRALTADIADPEAMRRVTGELGRCDAVVHAGADLDPAPMALGVALTNCLGTETVLRAAHDLGASRFIYISGVSVIGTPRVVPITEEHPVAPLTAYHATKLCGEYLVSASAAQSAISAASLRLTAPSGPGLAPDRIMAVFVKRALAGEPIVLLGRGTRRQNYVDVRDVGDAVATAISSAAEGIFNVAAAESISNRELAETCVTELGSSSPITQEGIDPEEGFNWEVSIERAERELGWRPQLTPRDSAIALAEEFKR